jgi:hypothetical protein
LFEDGFEIVDDFVGENVGIGKIVGAFEAFGAEPEDVAAKKLACPRFLPLNKSNSHARPRSYVNNQA